MQRFPYQTIQRFHDAETEERDNKKQRRGFILRVVCLIASVAAIIWMQRDIKSMRAQTKTQAGEIRMTLPLAIDQAEPEAIASGPLYDVLTEALAAWGTSGFPLKTRPVLYSRWHCSPAGEAIACAGTKEGVPFIGINDAVWFATFSRAFRKTVMMHEVGHVLGVPHIEGDPLMAPVLADSLVAPTPQALALAALHRQ